MEQEHIAHRFNRLKQLLQAAQEPPGSMVTCTLRHLQDGPKGDEHYITRGSGVGLMWWTDDVTVALSSLYLYVFLNCTVTSTCEVTLKWSEFCTRANS